MQVSLKTAGFSGVSSQRCSHGNAREGVCGRRAHRRMGGLGRWRKAPRAKRTPQIRPGWFPARGWGTGQPHCLLAMSGDARGCHNGGILSASGGQRPGVLLNALRRKGRPPATERHPARNTPVPGLRTLSHPAVRGAGHLHTVFSSYWDKPWKSVGKSLQSRLVKTCK